jgi:predicted transcriptional regulator of viral defense system
MSFAGNGRNIFTLHQATEFWGSSHNAKIAIHRLITKGWLSQIEKGKYLIIPFEAGTSRMPFHTV